MKKIKSLVSPLHNLQTAIVYKNEDEFVVMFFNNGEHMIDADYFTDDKADAMDTAAFELNREWAKAAETCTVELPISDELARDVLNMAVDCGISYWVDEARVIASRKREDGTKEYGTLLITESDRDEGPHMLSNGTVKRGMARALAVPRKCRIDIVQSVLAAIIDNDACPIDAEIADVIVQLGLFDEIVYG